MWNVEGARIGVFLKNNNFYYNGKVDKETMQDIHLTDNKGKQWIIPKTNIASLEVQKENYTDSYTEQESTY